MIARFPVSRRTPKVHRLEEGMRFGARVFVRMDREGARVRCDCGHEGHVRARALLSGERQRCAQCQRREAAGRRAPVVTVGDTHGAREVIAVHGEHVEMRCACGRVDTVRARVVLAGTSRTCVRCSDPMRGVPIRMRRPAEVVQAAWTRALEMMGIERSP